MAAIQSLKSAMKSLIFMPLVVFRPLMEDTNNFPDIEDSSVLKIGDRHVHGSSMTGRTRTPLQNSKPRL